MAEPRAILPGASLSPRISHLSQWPNHRHFQTCEYRPLQRVVFSECSLSRQAQSSPISRAYASTASCNCSAAFLLNREGDVPKSGNLGGVRRARAG